MKKRILLFIMSAISLIATLAFVNNIFAIVDWWRSFIAAGGNSAAMEPHHGCISWLDWSAVDYSAVTTFIPMVGFWCMTAGLFKITRRKRVKVENFPFYKGSDQLNVALGLFGTLWGIIVIGYFDLSTVSMADLMQCLHTALFSTLMAVVWVFMIDRPLVRPLFARMLAADDLADTDEDDLASAVERLVVRLGAASDEFDKRIKAYEEASESRQRAYEERFQKSFKSLNHQNGGNVHGRGEGVVRGLAHIHVVVGVQNLCPCDFVAAVGNDLVGVHVRLGTRPRLPDHQGEMLQQRAVHHLVTSRFDGGQFFGGHLFGTECVVGNGGGFFQHTEGVDNLGGHGFDADTDFKIFVASLGLCSPKTVGGDFNLAHRIVFNTEIHDVHPFGIKISVL